MWTKATPQSPRKSNTHFPDIIQPRLSGTVRLGEASGKGSKLSKKINFPARLSMPSITPHPNGIGSISFGPGLGDLPDVKDMNRRQSKLKRRSHSCVDPDASPMSNISNLEAKFEELEEYQSNSNMMVSALSPSSEDGIISMEDEMLPNQNFENSNLVCGIDAFNNKSENGCEKPPADITNFECLAETRDRNVRDIRMNKCIRKKVTLSASYIF
ncbi:hypothetical protein TRFO_06011 [Tritrichomonas foetus]|uniref:Uncharacterized protein n=1 Tax=Tritrichomonas foetus TaxID=1144522 RepID=A0A1J4K6G4_9EUKA|nr:hypothetical protein TRFO_06011 [Tritrichomonas foetus]|eukprot:OHT05037.1 hypothetical protein TRFO_06011 [Tritrichomonas foetus]